MDTTAICMYFKGSVNFKKEVPLHPERDPVVLLTETMHWDNELCYFGYQCDEENHGIPIIMSIICECGYSDVH